MTEPLREPPFVPIRIAVLTVSDTRVNETDTSGGLLAERIAGAGHTLTHRQIVADDKYAIRACISGWIADPGVDAIIVTGGTGLTHRDVTPEAVRPLLDREIEGFGELFREISRAQVGTATLQSRALGGIANSTFVFCVPGSTNACATAWDEILSTQLDARTRPCNLIQLIPRLKDFEARG